MLLLPDERHCQPGRINLRHRGLTRELLEYWFKLFLMLSQFLQLPPVFESIVHAATIAAADTDISFVTRITADSAFLLIRVLPPTPPEIYTGRR